VGGIPYYSSEDDIRSYFEGCGTITEIDCMTFPDTGKFRGIAIINFKVRAKTRIFSFILFGMLQFQVKSRKLFLCFLNGRIDRHISVGYISNA